MTKKASIAAITLVVLLLCGGAAVAFDVIGSDDKPAQPRSEVAASPEMNEAFRRLEDAAAGKGAPSAVPAEAKESFSVFRRAAGEQDRAVRELSPQLEHMSANAELARVVIVADAKRADDSAYFAVPARDGTVCFVDDTSSGGCSAFASVQKQGTLGSNECVEKDGKFFVTLHGFVPDGVDAVILRSAAGEQTVPVEANGWYAEFPQFPAEARPTTVSWADGESTVGVPYSPDINNRC